MHLKYGKPVYYHNLYYEPDTVFVEDKSPSTTTNNQENPNLKITFNHQNVQENCGILEKNYEQFKKLSCNKYYFNLQDGTINSFLYCFRNPMYNAYQWNKNNFLNETRNKTDLHRSKFRYVNFRICAGKKSITQR